MQNIVLILACLAIGFLLRLSGRLPEDATKTLGGFVINVALPAAALHNVHNLEMTSDWLLAAATPWIAAIVAILLVLPAARMFGWTRRRTGAVILVAGWGNTSFVGLPMIAALAGKQWLGLGIVIDLFGSYLALSTIGLAVASVASAGRFDWRDVAKRIVTFPPLIALVVAILLNRVERPDWFVTLVGALAETLTPVALVAVGHAIGFAQLRGELGPLALGLGYRLVGAPALILLLYIVLERVGDPVARTAILEAAMPPMLGASIIAIQNDLEPDLVALAIGAGVVLSMVSAPLWWSVLPAFG